jgi:hypothetical protein
LYNIPANPHAATVVTAYSAVAIPSSPDLNKIAKLLMRCKLLVIGAHFLLLILECEYFPAWEIAAILKIDLGDYF